MKRYAIKKRAGQFDVYQDGDWLSTFDEREDAEREVAEHIEFDKLRERDNAKE